MRLMRRMGLVMMVAACCVAPPALYADLTAVATPGYQFPLDGSVAPTYDLLNLLALPSIAIYGTIGGSNTLSPGTVTGVSLSDNLPDGATVVWNGNAPRQLAVRAAGLVTGGDGIVEVTNMFKLSYDPNYFQLSTNSWPNTNSNTGNGLVNWLTPIPGAFSNAVTLPANALGWGGTNVAGSNVLMAGLLIGPDFTVKPVTNATAGTTNSGPGLALHLFTSTQVVLGGSGINLLQAHNLGYTPRLVRGVLLCVSANNNYNPGDEVELSGAFSAVDFPEFECGANATNVWVTRYGDGKLYLFDKAGGVRTLMADANWRLMIYAW